MFQQQPMKMASAESLCHSETDPDFSILTVGTHNNCDSVGHLIEVPYVLPFLAEGRFNGVNLEGVKDLQEEYEAKYGPGDYRPNLFVTYWSFRAMIGFMAFPALFAVVALWLTRRGRIPDQRWFSRLALLDAADAVPRQQRWLGVHRDGPPAVGGRAESDRRPDAPAHGRPRRVWAFGRPWC